MTPVFHHLASTTSTNDDAKRAADAGEAEGYVVWADKQTVGRGRQGRDWESPEGNLYCSVLLRPKTLPQELGQYSFVAALALYDTVGYFLQQAVITLKWPNDILVNGKKIGGILLEAGGDWLVVGIGLNIAHYPGDALYPATSMAAEGGMTDQVGSIDMHHFLKTLMDHLNRWYDIAATQGFAPVRSAWLEYAQGGPMSVKVNNQTMQGVFHGLDDQGRLLLKLADGSERAIATGDVFFAPKE